MTTKKQMLFPFSTHDDPAASLAAARHEFGEHGGVTMSIEASDTFTVMKPETMRKMFSGELGPDRDFFIYSQHFNPTVLNLSRHMAALEFTEAAYCTSRLLEVNTEMDDIIIRYCVICGLSGMLIGIDTGLFPAVLMHFEKNFKSVDAAKVVTNISAIMGAGLGGFLPDLYGRTFSIKSSDILYILGSLITVWPPFFSMALLGRVLIGLGIGLASVSSNVYVSEIAPLRIRGKLLSAYGLSMSLGFLISNGIVQVSIKSPGGWVWLLGLPSIPVAIHFCFVCKLFESPRWLIFQGKFDEALEIIKKLFPSSEVPNIYNQMRDTASGSMPKFFSIFKKPNFQSALLGSFSVQLTHSIGAKGTSKLGTLDPNSDSPAFSAVLLILGSIGTIFSIDKFGRKKLLIASLISSIILFYVMSITSFYSAQSVAAVHNETLIFGQNHVCPPYLSVPQSWDCIVCLEKGCAFCSSPVSGVDPGACLLSSNETQALCLEKGRKYLDKSCPNSYGYVTGALSTGFKLVHTLGLSVVPAVVTVEIFPRQHLGLGAGLGFMFGYFVNFISALLFTLAKIESLWAICSVEMLSAAIALLFVCIFLPETGGLPLEDKANEHASIP